MGSVLNNGSLAFNRSDVIEFGGVVSGTGSLTQHGFIVGRPGEPPGSERQALTQRPEDPFWQNDFGQNKVRHICVQSDGFSRFPFSPSFSRSLLAWREARYFPHAGPFDRLMS
jgi:hypothetical protein